MTLALVLFGVAATGGLLLAYLRFTNKPLPMPLAMLHGLIAASGLVALAMTVLDGTASSKARIAFFIFLGAALGGITLFSFHLRKKALPLGIVAAHGLTAVVAFVVLLLAVLGTE
jgi:hypothetical protein